MPPEENKAFKRFLYSIFGGLVVVATVFAIFLSPADESEEFLSTSATLRSFLHLADRAILETERGSITIDFRKDLAPNAVANFIKLADKGFYDDTIFHRTIAGGVIQGGDPEGTGEGGPGYTIVPERSDTSIRRGLVLMVREGNVLNGSQFIIVAAQRVPDLDGTQTVFGEVTSGMETVDSISRARVDGNSKPVSDITLKRIILIGN